MGTGQIEKRTERKEGKEGKEGKKGERGETGIKHQWEERKESKKRTRW